VIGEVTPVNLITMLKAHTPVYGSLAPFFNTTSDKMNVYNDDATVFFKLVLIGSYTGGSSHRSLGLTFVGSPNEIYSNRNAETPTDVDTLSVFLSVDKGGNFQANGAVLELLCYGTSFTVNEATLVAEQITNEPTVNVV